MGANFIIRQQINKMFRQKMAEVTDCSCRLIASHSNQYQLFKVPDSHIKPVNKEPKEKYSLKTQTTSSNKHDNKVTSAQKICLKPAKLSQEQKISISGNLDAKRQKLQKNLVCSPENSQVRKLDQNIIFGTTPNSIQSYFGRMQNSVKTAQNSKFRFQKRGMLSSHNQIEPQNKGNREGFGASLQQQKYQQFKGPFSKVTQPPKKSLNFDQYYKYMSNPYCASDKNKQNISNGENVQISKYKLDLKIKKQMRRMRNQSLPLQEIDIPPQIQVFHQSLQKYENPNPRQNRGTFNSSLTTQNSLKSQSDSMKNSKTNQISLMNSKISNLNQNPSLQINMIFDQVIRQNQSAVVLTQRDINISSQTVARNNIRNNDSTDEFGFKNCKNRFECRQVNRPYSTAQNSQVKTFITPMQNLRDIPLVKQQHSYVFHDSNNNQTDNQKVFIEKINTLNDIMNNSVQCESVLGEGEQENQNDQSIVIMRYQDLLEETQKNKHVVQESNFWLRPQQLASEALDDSNCNRKSMLESIKIATNIKPSFRQHQNPVGESAISTNPHLKKTVKVSKQYLTENFSQEE